MVFNLSETSSPPEASQPSADLLKSELIIHSIITGPDHIICTVGDEDLTVYSLDECLDHVNNGIKELQGHLWEEWKDLAYVAETIVDHKSHNEGSIDNLIFLNSVKKSYVFSKVFSDLEDISTVIRPLFDLDVAQIEPELVSAFNLRYLKVKLIHKLIMNEIYRSKILKKYMQLTKTASISGPWANLDLPMQERVWDWDDEESEYFDNRDQAIKDQVRYNPEYTMQGYYFVWQDLSRDPYLFQDMKKDSPYKSRHTLLIP